MTTMFVAGFPPEVGMLYEAFPRIEIRRIYALHGIVLLALPIMLLGC